MPLCTRRHGGGPPAPRVATALRAGLVLFSKANWNASRERKIYRYTPIQILRDATQCFVVGCVRVLLDHDVWHARVLVSCLIFDLDRVVFDRLPWAQGVFILT